MIGFSLHRRIVDTAIPTLALGLLGLTLCAVAAGGALAQVKDACSSADLSKPPSKPVEIRYGLTGGGEQPLALLWADKSAYPDNGKFYDLKATRYRPTDRMAAFQAGQLDAGTISLPGLIAAVHVGMDARAVASLVQVNKVDNEGSFVSLSSSDIRSVKDFAGKRVGYYGPNTISEYWVRNAMKKAGLDPRNVSFVALPPPAQEQAMRNGQIDIAWLARQFFARANRKGGIEKILTPYQATGSNQPSLLIFFSSKFVNANPAAYCAWRADYQRAMKTWIADPGAAYPKLIRAKYVRPFAPKAGPDAGRSPDGAMSLKELSATMQDMVASQFLRSSMVRPATELVLQGYALVNE
ncbi:MAG: ABC transporter substrate-binding protein [Defluviicoccus sp.]|nr:ABC transporter substrate-binding protein [Defluviicoccus sp.]